MGRGKQSSDSVHEKFAVCIGSDPQGSMANSVHELPPHCCSILKYNDGKFSKRVNERDSFFGMSWF